MNILQCKDLIVESSNFGAELTRIYSKKLNREILWNGNSKFWGRHSPILFPIVGRLKNNETIIEDNLYNMTQHGFARDMKFKTIDVNDKSITYSLASDLNTKEFYPYSFELIVKYTVLDSTINIEWTVINTDNKDIFFSVGAHPAFNLNFQNSENISDYYIEFTHKDKVDKISLNGPYSDKTTPVNNLSNLSLNSKLFKGDALIYTNIDSICLKSYNSDNFINVSLENFPLVGIWTPYYPDTNSTAPFLCIEPWYGLSDNINADKVFKNKNYINRLSVNNKFTVSYDISIG